MAGDAQDTAPSGASRDVERVGARGDAWFDPLDVRHPSRRLPVYARNGMVCCSNPMAAAAGLAALRAGGTAADAVVAAAATLTVVEPTSNGIGSDAFALAWSAADRRLYGLNASGPAPTGISHERVIADGHAERRPDGTPRMPRFGWTPVTVPGAPAAWAALVGRLGARTLAQDLADAVAYARDGYALAPHVARCWARDVDEYVAAWGARRDTGGSDPHVFDEWLRVFAPDGVAPRAGDLVRLPDHAATLEAIGATDAETFYRGRVAERIDAASRAGGGYLRAGDLASFRPQWVEPLALPYRDRVVCEIPPNGQGIATLMALNILAQFDLAGDAAARGAVGVAGRDDELTCHRQIEAMKAAFADALATVSDPAFTRVDYARYLDPAYGAARAREIGARARDYGPLDVGASGTVYLCAADAAGNMVSYIQSNYQGFGSGVVVPGTGVSLQDRGADFSLDPRAANALLPGKRTYHTIIPGFLMDAGAAPAHDGSLGVAGVPVGPFGVMGAYMQPQGHLQVVLSCVDFHLNPQQALDAPRWQWLRDGTLALEPALAARVGEALAARGHRVRTDLDVTSYGRGQMIVRLPNGTLVGGTEPRCDGCVASY